MRRQFTTREWEQIYSTDTDRRKLNNFYRFWVSSILYSSVQCVSQSLPLSLSLSLLSLSLSISYFQSLKESFIKAEGSGLSYGLQNLEFVAASSWPPQLSVSNLSYDYCVTEISIICFKCRMCVLGPSCILVVI